MELRAQSIFQERVMQDASGTQKPRCRDIWLFQVRWVLKQQRIPVCDSLVLWCFSDTSK